MAGTGSENESSDGSEGIRYDDEDDDTESRESDEDSESEEAAILNVKRKRKTVSYVPEIQEWMQPLPDDEETDDRRERYLEKCAATEYKYKSRPTKENTYQHPHQKELLEILEAKGLTRMAHKLILDEGAPGSVSRIHKAKCEDVVMLLAQLEKKVLRAILSNTFDAEAQEAGSIGNIWRQDWDAGQKTGPGLYVNVFAPANGGGLDRDQLELLVHAMRKLSLEADDDEDADERLTKRLTKHGVKIGDGVRFQWQNIAPKYLESEKEKDRIRDRLWRLANAWEGKLRSTPLGSGCENFCVCIEGGWTHDLAFRLLRHKEGASTPTIFLTVRSILLHLFPEMHFTLRQYVVLRALHPRDAAIGECMVHQLFATYVAQGGCNVAQAGISVKKAETMTDEEWKKAEKTAVDVGLLAVIEESLVEEDEKLRSLAEAAAEAMIAEHVGQIEGYEERIESKLLPSEEYRSQREGDMRNVVAYALPLGVSAVQLQEVLDKEFRF